MQKSEKKLNANAVGGDAHIDPLKQKGITLIALIITIIVMMILVGVTISVAINGGLFNTADDATKRTEKHSIYDQIIGAMKLTDNGNVNVKGTYDEVVKMFGDDKVEPIDPEEVKDTTPEVIFTVTGKRGTYTYKITGTGIEIPDEKGGGGGQNPPELLEFPYGKYYENGDDDGWRYKIFTENSYKEGEIGYKIVDLQLKDGETITVKVTMMNDGKEEEGTGELKYIATQNAVFLDMGGMYCVKSENGVVYDLDGRYIPEEGQSLGFTLGSGEVTEYRPDGVPNGSTGYVSFGGKYYLQGYGEMVFTDGYKSFTVDGITYTNENASSTKPEITYETITPTSVDFIYGTYDCGNSSVIIDEKCVSRESFEVAFDEMNSFPGKLLYEEETDTLYATDRYGKTRELNYIKEGNDVIIWGEGLGLYATSKNAFKSMNLDLEGEYVSGTTKLVFEQGNQLVREYYDMNSDGVFEYEHDVLAYIEKDNKYYRYGDGREIQIGSDRNTITIETTTYTKVN